MSFDEDETEDIQRAIAMSLRDGDGEVERSVRRRKEVIDVDADGDSDSDLGMEDDADVDMDVRYEQELKTAIELSKGEKAAIDAGRGPEPESLLSPNAQTNPSSPTPTPESRIRSSAPSSQTQTQNLNHFIANRAQLEQERLERQKRLRAQHGVSSRSASPPASGSGSQTISGTASRNGESGPPTKKLHTHTSADEDGTETEDEDVGTSTTHPTSKGKEKGAITTRTNGGIRIDNPRSSISTSNSTSTSNQTPLGQARYWDGALRQNANMHVDRTKDTKPIFRLSDILADTTSLKLAILSSFSTDLAWLYSLFPPSIPVILIQHPEDGERGVKNILPNWVRTTPNLVGGRGVMHVKLLLLFYPTHLRICITTANFAPYDWRDIENTVWVQDVPPIQVPTANPTKSSLNLSSATSRLTQTQAEAWTTVKRASKRKDSSSDPGSEFVQILINVLIRLNVPPALSTLHTDHPTLPLRSLMDLATNWDWSRVKARLVPCMSGKYEGWPQVLTNGHTRLMKAVREVNARVGPNRNVLVECQGSSIGTCTPSWLTEFLYSCRGESPEEWLDMPRSRRMKVGVPSGLKICYPSLTNVKESVLGEIGGGTMFCRRSQWRGAKFPRELFHDSKSKRGKVLMHSKMILATFTPTPSRSTSSTKHRPKQKQTKLVTKDPNSSDSDDVIEIEPGIDNDIHGWAYIGSANFTPSAWGTLSGSGFNPILNITNYELGIVIPLVHPGMADEVCCWERPPRKYGEGDSPWMQEESLLLQAAAEQGWT